MRFRSPITALAGVGLAASAALARAPQPPQPPRPHVPPRGYVPDSATAVAIAVAVWTPSYGAATIRRERPYTARLKDGVWRVDATLPCPRGATCVGGAAYAEIAQADARVLLLGHSK